MKPFRGHEYQLHFLIRAFSPLFTLLIFQFGLFSAYLESHKYPKGKKIKSFVDLPAYQNTIRTGKIPSQITD